jgi:hypothetical protein
MTVDVDAMKSNQMMTKEKMLLVSQERTDRIIRERDKHGENQDIIRQKMATILSRMDSLLIKIQMERDQAGNKRTRSA